MSRLPKPVTFERNSGNNDKNLLKHNVTIKESEEEEREFWDTHDFSDYKDQFQPVKLDLSKLKSTTESISLSLPSHLLADIKTLANKNEVPYQSLMKIYLSERVKKEFRNLRKTDLRQYKVIIATVLDSQHFYR